MHRTQTFRDVAFNCPLGPDALLLRAFDGKEALGRLFEYEVELLSEQGRIDPRALLGAASAVRLNTGRDSRRWFHGIVTRFRQVRGGGRLHHYRATLRPWLWLLTRTTDCRIYQELTVPQIIGEVFKTYGFGDVRMHLTHDYAAREYCVQYRETAFDFLSRLMEEEGIYYQFEHHEDKHVLVLHDSPIGHDVAPGCEALPLRAEAGGAGADDSVWDWGADHQVLPGALSLEAYDFKNPTKPLRVLDRLDREHAHDEFEVFDYSTRYVEVDDGDRLARVRLESIQAAHRVYSGASDARGLRTGGLIRFRQTRNRVDQPMLVTAAEYRMRSDAYESGRGSEEPVFECRFEALPLGVPFRTAQRTTRPEIRGPQTAMVVGPEGQEIYVDEHARVKVQFHWDRYGKRDDSSSCWIRVSQPWAGGKFGAMFIPRIGHEVVVEFLEGDPDRPLITGRVYNGANAVPHDLPANATVSCIRSESSPGGGGFNELRFEDKKGSEEVYLHAQKDRLVVVNNNNTESVGANETLGVSGDRAKTVNGNETTNVGGNRTENVAGNEAVSVGGNRALTVAGNDATTVGANQSTAVGANQSTMVGANQSTVVGANRTVAVGANEQASVASMRTTVVGMMDSLNVGLIQNINAGIAIAINAGVVLSLVSPGGSITLTPSGIEIKGKSVKIEGDIVEINP